MYHLRIVERLRLFHAREPLLGNLLLVLLATEDCVLLDGQLRFYRAIGLDRVSSADLREVLDEISIILAVLHSSSPLPIDLRQFHRLRRLFGTSFVVVSLVIIVMLLGLLVEVALPSFHRLLVGFSFRELLLLFHLFLLQTLLRHGFFDTQLTALEFGAIKLL